MSFISFSVHICGMTGKNLPGKLMIDTPLKSIDFFYNLDYADTPSYNDRISQLIEYIKIKELELLTCLDRSSLKRFCIDNIYVEYKGYYWGFEKDIKLETLFELLKTDHLKMHYFYVAGGASRTINGYRFAVWPNENIHKYDDPHVHVIKEGKSPRYSLKTFKMFEGDEFSREHIRDKKKIKKYLKDNKDWLLEKWNLSMSGLVPPTETLDSKQLIKES